MKELTLSGALKSSEQLRDFILNFWILPWLALHDWRIYGRLIRPDQLPPKELLTYQKYQCQPHLHITSNCLQPKLSNDAERLFNGFETSVEIAVPLVSK